MRRLAAIYFADIVGYTPLSARDENAALRLIRALQSIGQEEVERVGGRVVKHLGDALLAEFSSAEAGARSAVRLARRFGAETTDGGASAPSLRVGLNVGELFFQGDGDVLGEAVNLASRLQAVAEPGQVLASEDVFRQLRRVADFRFQMIGSRELKGVPEPVPVFSVDLEGETADAPACEVPAARPARSVPNPAPRAPQPGARPTRIVVVPFRVLREDAEMDFLGFSLPDAISCSLRELRSLTVRSPAAASSWAGGDGDPRAIARALDVDVVLTGTILRIGDRLRVTSQLADGHDGTMLWSRSEQVSLDDLFRLQDELTGNIVGSLRIPLSEGDRRGLGAEVPAHPLAYELYLRANELAIPESRWAEARELYRQALVHDPEYAPAWARLARCHRLIGKYSGTVEERDASMAQATSAFERALELGPELSLAHQLYAQMEIEDGRAVQAMERLITRVIQRGPDAESFAALVSALRYCGLLAESLLASERARAIDPSLPTSVAYTFLAMGDHEGALATAAPGDRAYFESMSLAGLGRIEEAIALLEAWAPFGSSDYVAGFARSAITAFRGEPDEALRIARPLLELFPDPEGRFEIARYIARAARPDAAIDILIDVVERGFLCAYAMRHDPWFDSIRSDARYPALLEQADAGIARARQAYERTGGPAILTGSS